MPFKTSKRVIEAIEKQIYGQPEQINKAISFLLREVFYPVKFLIKGFDLWYRDFLKFTLLYMIIALLFFWVLCRFLQLEGAILFILPFAFVISMVLSMFSAPSSFSFCGVKQEHIQTVVDVLSRYKIVSVVQIDKIADNINLYEKRVMVRIVSLRGFLGLCWAAVIYFFTQSFTEALKAKTSLLKVQADMAFLSLLFIAVLILYVGVESYAKINTLIFRTALLGCNEYMVFITQENLAKVTASNK